LVAGLATLMLVGAALAIWTKTGPAEPLPAPEYLGSATDPTRPRVLGPGVGTWQADAPQATGATADTALCPGCDVVLVTVCSLRRDHVGLYGAAGDLTPRLDAWLARAFRFDQAYAAGNFTLAGLTALLTGRFGSSTGVTSWDKGLVADVPTLPEILGLYGYRTGAFTTDAPSGFRPDYGLDRGFQHMEIIPPPRDNPDGAHQDGPIGPGGASAQPAARWIAEQPADAPLFVMFHTRTAHYPFVLEDDPDDATGVTSLLWQSGMRTTPAGAMPGTAGGTSQRGVVEVGTQDPVQEGVRAAGAAGEAVWRARYREAVARTDADLGVLADALTARGRLGRTVIVLLADHGESLGDHGELLHGDAYYDGVVHIPMFIRLPDGTGGAVPALASQVDLLPTLLELVGAMSPAGIDGRSLLPVITGQADQVRGATLVEGGVSWRDDGQLRGALISPPWTLLRQDRGCGSNETARAVGEPATCLFNLDLDPAQDHNLARSETAVVEDLLSRWQGFTASRSQGQQLDLDPALVEELQRTGYDFRPLDAQDP
jgi:arylsulfatase A-like enzyme